MSQAGQGPGILPCRSVEGEAVGGSQAEQNAEVRDSFQRVALMGRDGTWVARWSPEVGDELLYRGDLKGAVWG